MRGLPRPWWGDATSVDPVDRNLRRASFTPGERLRVDGARVARLATVRPDGRPHLVPVTFASAGTAEVVTAVDHNGSRLKRLAENMARLSLPCRSIEADLLAWNPDEALRLLWREAKEETDKLSSWLQQTARSE